MIQYARPRYYYNNVYYHNACILTELKASFKKFDKANKGYVDAKEVGPLMKAAKQIDSDKDIDTVILHAGVESK